MITCHQEGGLAILTIGESPSNVLSMHHFNRLREILDRTAGSRDVTGLIITGRGRHFSSGADLGELLAHAGPDTLTLHRNIIGQMLSFPKPLVAAVRGVCLGAAFEITLACHARICSPDAVFGLPESSYNLMPGLGGISNLSRLTGNARMLRLVLEGNTFTAREAYEWGITDALVPRGELMAAASSLVLKIPALAGNAILK